MPQGFRGLSNQSACEKALSANIDPANIWLPDRLVLWNNS
jgi:hypothetical protein